MRELKEKLDQATEMLQSFFLMSQAVILTREKGHDRAHYRNLLKGLLDITRYTESSVLSKGKIRTREECLHSVLGRKEPPLAPLIETFVQWQEHHYDPGLYEESCIHESLFRGFARVREFGTFFERDITRTETGASSQYQVLSLSGGYSRESLSANSSETSFQQDVSQLLVETLPAQVKAVWHSYYHIYVFVTGTVSLEQWGSFFNQVFFLIRDFAGSDKQALAVSRCRFLFVPVEAIRLFLYSCYLNNPFKYFDFSLEKGVYSPDPFFQEHVPPPPSGLTETMTQEAVANAYFTLRMDLKRTGSPSQVYRTFLRILRLRIFLQKKKVIFPLAQVPRLYRDCYADEGKWVEALEEDYLSLNEKRLQTGDDLFWKYYPEAKRSIDSIVF